MSKIVSVNSAGCAYWRVTGKPSVPLHYSFSCMIFGCFWGNLASRVSGRTHCCYCCAHPGGLVLSCFQPHQWAAPPPPACHCSCYDLLISGWPLPSSSLTHCNTLLPGHAKSFHEAFLILPEPPVFHGNPVSPEALMCGSRSKFHTQEGKRCVTLCSGPCPCSSPAPLIRFPSCMHTSFSCYTLFHMPCTCDLLQRAGHELVQPHTERVRCDSVA